MANSDLVTVYRSADPDAGDDAVTARDLLREAGIAAEVYGDDAPGVVEGSWEVRVPAADSTRAEEILASNREEVETHVDPSHDLDLVTILHASEVEAVAIRGILEANGIDTVVAGTQALPNLPFEIRVPKGQEQQARAALAEAEAEGPAAAEEASGQAAE